MRRCGLLLGLLLASPGWAVAADPAVPPLRALPPVAFTLADFAAQAPRNGAGDYRLEIPEMVNLSLSVEARAVLLGKSVEFAGQVLAETQTAPNVRRLSVGRSLIPCCVSHAKQYSLSAVLPETAPHFQPGEWVQMVGTITYPPEPGPMRPLVLVRQIVKIAEPSNAMLK